MPRLAFNRHAALRAGAHEHDGLHRKRRVELKLAPHPYPHRSPFIQVRSNTRCHDPGEAIGSSVAQGTSPKTTARGHIYELERESCRVSWASRPMNQELRRAASVSKIIDSPSRVIGPRYKTTNRRPATPTPRRVTLLLRLAHGRLPGHTQLITCGSSPNLGGVVLPLAHLGDDDGGVHVRLRPARQRLKRDGRCRAVIDEREHIARAEGQDRLSVVPLGAGPGPVDRVVTAAPLTNSANRPGSTPDTENVTS